MKIVIVGAGEVGTHLAKLLSGENQDIIIVDADRRKLELLDGSCNLLTLRGNPISFDVMREARVGECDLFVALTPEETTNVVACTMAKSLGAKKTVARIDNYEFMRKEHSGFFSRQGVDVMIYPEYLAAREILKALERNWVRNWFEIHDGQLIVVGIKIHSNSELAGMKLRDLSTVSHNFHVSAISRYNDTIMPRGNDAIQPGDIVYFTTVPEGVDELRRMCGKQVYNLRRILIMGGSRIAVRLVNMAPDRYRFSIIEQDRDRCLRLAELCPQATIINADGRDIDILREEGITETDAFIALTDRSEANILTCLTSKEYGVVKTIAEVENLQFVPEAEKLNIGTVINKKLLASAKVFQMLLDSDSDSSKFLALANADVAEIEVRPGAKATRGPVKSLNLPVGMNIAGLIRPDGTGHLVSGDTQIMAGDHVVVFCVAGIIHKIERLFS